MVSAQLQRYRRLCKTFCMKPMFSIIKRSLNMKSPLTYIAIFLGEESSWRSKVMQYTYCINIANICQRFHGKADRIRVLFQAGECRASNGSVKHLKRVKAFVVSTAMSIVGYLTTIAAQQRNCPLRVSKPEERS